MRVVEAFMAFDANCSRSLYGIWCHQRSL